MQVDSEQHPLYLVPRHHTQPMGMLFRSLPVSGDSRAQKMLNAYRSAGLKVQAISWSRGLEPNSHSRSDDGVTYYDGAGLVGSGKRNIPNLIKWFWHIAITMFRQRREFQFVHVVDFDTAVVAVPLGRLLGKKLVYDAFDILADGIDNRLLRSLFRTWERFLMNFSHIVLLPNLARIEQYGLEPRENILQISNIPDVPVASGNTSLKPQFHITSADPRAFTICYIGTLERTHRGLEYIQDAIKQCQHISFVIGGTGALRPYFEDIAATSDRLSFLGPVSYDAALAHMANSDCLYGPYLLSSRHHKFASPNKMYEHLLLAKPLITNTGTPPGDFVGEHKTGFLFDGTADHLIALLQSLDSAACREAGLTAGKVWRNKVQYQRANELERFFSYFTSVVSTK